MARSRVTLKSAGMEELLNGKIARAACEGPARAVLAAAQASAPVDSGAYRDSLHIVEDHTDRLAFRIVADVDHAMVVEANTGNLSRALDAAGS